MVVCRMPHSPVSGYQNNGVEQKPSLHNHSSLHNHLRRQYRKQGRTKTFNQIHVFLIYSHMLQTLFMNESDFTCTIVIIYKVELVPE